MKDEVTRIYLVRHGEVTNTKGIFRYNGHTDVDITDLGIAQMEAVAERLKTESLKGVYATGLIRTVKGAEIIARHHGLTPLADDRFKEVNAGRWEGLSYVEVQEQFPDEAHVRFEDLINYRIKGGGESLRDVQERVIPALNNLIERHKGESVALIAHGGVNRVILCYALNMSLESFFRIEQDYGCLNIIDFYDGSAVVRLMNSVMEEI